MCQLFRFAVAGAFLACAATVPAADEAAPAASGLKQSAYVWQRQWSPALRHDLVEDAADFSGYDVLGAEIDWPDGLPAVHRVEVDWETLRQAGRPVGIVIRVAPRNGRWTAGSVETHAVVDTCLDLGARARTHGVDPAELQIDFDAATSGLGEYRALVREVRQQVAPHRLVITALPDWMNTSDFQNLLLEVDAYVLQVHSLEKPGRIEATYKLFDPERATRWIETASSLHHPFRLALPTYGYRLDFDRDGNFAALEAEGPQHLVVPVQQQRLALSDPAVLADFVRPLLASPPPACEGISWFRFPVREDELAWSWPTLRAVMHGTVPVSGLTLLCAASGHGLLDLFEVNQGAADATPASFRITWKEARLKSVDGLGGWRVERESADTIVVRPPLPGSNGLLRPGDRLRVGWIRFNHNVSPVCSAIP